MIVLVTGGGEATGGHDRTASAVASRLQNVGGRRVPLYVVAIAPPSSADVELRAIATAGGGQYARVEQADIDAAYEGALVSGGDATVPAAAAAVETAIQHALADPADVNQPPTAAQPYGPPSEYQQTGPVVGTVDSAGARYADGRAIADATAVSSSGAVLPQRSNLLVTSAFALPGFGGVLRGVRVYRPVADAARDTGVAFVSDGGLLLVGTHATVLRRAQRPRQPQRIYRASGWNNGAVRVWQCGRAREISPSRRVRCRRVDRLGRAPMARSSNPHRPFCRRRPSIPIPTATTRCSGSVFVIAAHCLHRRQRRDASRDRCQNRT